jgi:hypothetical protein
VTTRSGATCDDPGMDRDMAPEREAVAHVGTPDRLFALR